MDTELLKLGYFLVLFLNKNNGQKFEKKLCEYELEFRAVPTSMNIVEDGELVVVSLEKKREEEIQ